MLKGRANASSCSFLFFFFFYSSTETKKQKKHWSDQNEAQYYIQQIKTMMEWSNITGQCTPCWGWIRLLVSCINFSRRPCYMNYKHGVLTIIYIKLIVIIYTVRTVYIYIFLLKIDICLGRHMSWSCCVRLEKGKHENKTGMANGKQTHRTWINHIGIWDKRQRRLGKWWLTRPYTVATTPLTPRLDIRWRLRHETWYAHTITWVCGHPWRGLEAVPRPHWDGLATRSQRKQLYCFDHSDFAYF